MKVAVAHHRVSDFQPVPDKLYLPQRGGQLPRATGFRQAPGQPQPVVRHLAWAGVRRRAPEPVQFRVRGTQLDRQFRDPHGLPRAAAMSGTPGTRTITWTGEGSASPGASTVSTSGAG